MWRRVIGLVDGSMDHSPTTKYETTQEPSQQAIALKVAIRRSAARCEGGEQRI
jgi:hypothetical protein